MDNIADKKDFLTNEINLLKAFENEDFSKLKDLQTTNQSKLKKNYFIKTEYPNMFYPPIEA